MSSDCEKETGGERRIDTAVALARIEVQLKVLNKTNDACLADRIALYDRMRQVDIQLSGVEIKQAGIFRGVYLLSLGLIATAGKLVYDALSHNSH